MSRRSVMINYRLPIKVAKKLGSKERGVETLAVRTWIPRERLSFLRVNRLWYNSPSKSTVFHDLKRQKLQLMNGFKA